MVLTTKDILDIPRVVLTRGTISEAHVTDVSGDTLHQIPMKPLVSYKPKRNTNFRF